jgi:hypothetical protein
LCVATTDERLAELLTAPIFIDRLKQLGFIHRSQLRKERPVPAGQREAISPATQVV